MGASFAPTIIPAGGFAFKRNTPMAFTNMNNGGACLQNAGIPADTTNNTFNSRSIQVVPTTCGGLTDIILGFPTFAQQSSLNPEINLPTAFTVTAAIEYPIGSTPNQLFFQGAASGTVTPGTTVLKTDPLPLFIPAGATFAVKVFGSWSGSFVFSGCLSSTQPTIEWTNRGVGLADNTLTLTPFTSTTGGLGYAPIVFGTPLIKTPVVGVMGDSIGVGANDMTDGTVWSTAWGRAGRNKMGVLNLAIGGSTMFSWLERLNGVSALYRDSITHLFFELGVNDISQNQSFAQMQANFQTLVEPFLARGVKVHACTIMPRSSSTDGWITTANQTVASVPQEAVRQSYNAWLRGNWSALGLSGLFDHAHVVDPTDAGKWICDEGATAAAVATTQGAFQPTLVDGVVTALNVIHTQSGGSTGVNYPNNVTIPWVATPYPGETGSGATGTVTTNGSNFIGSWTVTTGGSGYSYPPLINLIGPWTADGLHPTTRGYNQLFIGGGYGPGAFTL